MPCQHLYAYSECRIAALEAAITRYLNKRGVLTDDNRAFLRAVLAPAPAPEGE